MTLIPTLLVLILFFSQLHDMIISNTIRLEQEHATKTYHALENSIAEVTSVSDAILSDSFFRTSLLTDTISYQSTEDSSQRTEDFIQTIHSLMGNNKISDIRIYTTFSDTSLYETYSVFQPISETKGSYWSGIFDGSSITSLYCPSFYLTSKEINQYGDYALITEITSYQLSGETTTSYVAVYFRSDYLTVLLTEAENNSAYTYVNYIINERDTLVASSDYNLSGTYLMDYETVQSMFMSSNNFIQKNILNNNVYACFYHIVGTDWYMVSILPEAPLLKKSTITLIIISAVYLFFLTCAYLMATILTHSITKRIGSVISQMGNNVHTGKLMPMQKSDFHDEISTLIDTYNFMIDQLNQLNEQQIKAVNYLRISEFNILQAQINPHFLYNTMTMINWLSLNGKNQKVTEAVQALSHFYRLTFSQSETFTTVENEIQHVQLYVQLQNMRFDDNISFIVDIPDELLNQSIPKLTLQPLVENSIQHGIMEKKSRQGSIIITGWTDDNTNTILITDNGVGIPPENLSHILTGELKSPNGNNIGVYNTHQRLQILYGKKYGLSYSSIVGEGTEAEITFPADSFSTKYQ